MRGIAEKSAAVTPLTPWRDVLKVHPAADLFPLLSDQELAELGADIKKNGLQTRVVILASPDHDMLLDGRNRLDAMERVGVPFDVGDPKLVREVWDVDPVEYVIGANIRHRHLTRDQQRELIEKLLKIDPSKSSNQIAETLGVSHNTVEAVRRKGQANCQIDNNRTEASGRKARGRKPGSNYLEPIDAAQAAAQIEREDKRAAKAHPTGAEAVKKAGAIMAELVYAGEAVQRSFIRQFPRMLAEREPEQIDLEEAIAADAETSATARKAAHAAEEAGDPCPGGEPANMAMASLCWLLLADGRDPHLAEHLATIAAAQDPDPFPVSAIERVIALLTDVVSRLRVKKVADPGDFPDMPAFLQREAAS